MSSSSDLFHRNLRIVRNAKFPAKGNSIEHNGSADTDRSIDATVLSVAPVTTDHVSPNISFIFNNVRLNFVCWKMRFSFGNEL